ncbi:hypothetical protein [Paracoccus aestuariivivens]|nr:hypothetical protein [Paracoccus aestuariivivens]
MALRGFRSFASYGVMPQRMPLISTFVDHMDRPRAEQVILLRGAEMGLHRRLEVAGILAKAYETLQFKANESEG